MSKRGTYILRGLVCIPLQCKNVSLALLGRVNNTTSDSLSPPWESPGAKVLYNVNEKQMKAHEEGGRVRIVMCERILGLHCV